MNERVRVAAATVVALVVAVLALLVPTTEGAYTAKINNSVNAAATNSYFTCTNAAKGDSAVYPSALYAYPFGETAGTVAADVTGNAHPGTYTSTGVTYGVANGGVCPRDGKTVITLNGSSGYIDGPSASTLNNALTNPQVFSLEIWFRTSTSGGVLVGFTNTGLGSMDRIIYIDTSGHLVFGVDPFLTGYTTVSSAAGGYADGTWHHVVATLSSSGMALYVDDQAGVTNSVAAAAVPLLGNPNFRFGSGSLTNWPNGGTNPYFRGNLAYAAVYTYALSAAQARSHYYAGR